MFHVLYSYIGLCFMYYIHCWFKLGVRGEEGKGVLFCFAPQLFSSQNYFLIHYFFNFLDNKK